MNHSDRVRKQSFVMVKIPAGNFTMGSRVGHGEDDEFPERQVWVDEFLMARFPVTAAEWALFLNKVGNPDLSYFEPSEETTVTLIDGIYYPRRKCARHPANGISWQGAAAFCEWLSEETGKEFRLPFEAEWEKAARGAMEHMRYPWGNNPPNGLAQFHQQWVDPRHTLSPVDSYPPNPFGLHDMVGNVWEWCSDWYEPDYYQASPAQNPEGPETGQMKVMRGGSWRCLDVQVRCAIRLGEWPDSSSSGAGFRLARWP
ncbi:MAG: formylglycine-generating enzyme family protein [Deltaproteobacteria bacterium]|nr:formylglycine-generating enzyme family protein [Deltaproteobacteria bacterium]MBW2085645.1 formylglycine-generating enzyme family protein [Deltaproteobacteria bacterium]